ncbi:Tfb4-domain-containing protein [Aspergillus heteromorphus CBS 117.55]|uniref:General transcription and DNA repair factor IIH subunit TFB4 n=1 Tax=Aspergillus heteromorphus CBS 117.55 TaxID=1448321 RepID=A0A317WI02_9EURO|nr:Tfb4-domain-containing protein [Aspergillus heteromorphus CBS 117.55]PWY84902.1 Tfb4-domain-containing protein [Aspergillus heteromorphus CBS 117.55]
MNSIDATDHYQNSAQGTSPLFPSPLLLSSALLHYLHLLHHLHPLHPLHHLHPHHHLTTNHARTPPSLLTVIIDTNPHAWALLHPSLPLSTAIANILVFLNAHLACNYANEVAVVASHTTKATWLYPVEHARHAPPNGSNSRNSNGNNTRDSDGDVSMSAPFADPFPNPDPPNPVNKYRPFRLVEEQVTATSQNNANKFQSRLLILSTTSSTKTSTQYIPLMNAIFACQRLSIPIDVCKLSGDAVFLQQAADATHGIYMSLSTPRGLLQYLMMAFLPDQRTRKHLVVPTRVDVDFRAACFCHRRVVDVGWVCSVCLSIFCEPIGVGGGRCWTCGSRLEGGEGGVRPAVVGRKKGKRKKRDKSGLEAGGTGTPGSVTQTPTPTPGP